MPPNSALHVMITLLAGEIDRLRRECGDDVIEVAEIIRRIDEIIDEQIPPEDSYCRYPLTFYGAYFYLDTGSTINSILHHMQDYGAIEIITVAVGTHEDYEVRAIKIIYSLDQPFIGPTPQRN